jgi:hypothetical protein
MRRLHAALATVGIVVLSSTFALGQEVKRCGEHGAPWIRLRTEGLSADLQTPLMTHVRSSLAARQIDVCVIDQPSVSSPLATLDVRAEKAAATTSIGVDDGVTQKRVSRDLDLSGLPPDGWALTIALALDELLRASWAELMLSDARPAAPPPSVVTEAIGSRPAIVAPPPAPFARACEIGAAFGGEHFSEGHDQLGVDVAGSYSPWPRLGFDARLGLRAGMPVKAPRGEIRSTALIGALGLDLALTPRTGRAGLDLLGDVSLARVTFVARPSAMGVRGNEQAAVASYVATGLRGWILVVPPIRAFVRVRGGAPLHTAYAMDGDVRVAGLGGILMAGDVGLSFLF